MFNIWLDDCELSDWAIKYCMDIKDDSRVRKYINNPTDAHLYCLNVRNDNKQLRQLAKSGGYNV